MESEEIFEDTPRKRKHITLTIQEKLDIIALIESKQYSRQAIANRYGIGKSTVHDIHKRRDTIREFASAKNTRDLAKRRRVDMRLSGSATKIDDQEKLIVEEVEEVDVRENEDNFVEYADEGDEEYTLVFEEQEVKPEETFVTPKVKHGDESLQDSKKRRSNTLTIRQKYDILNHLESGKSVPWICTNYCIGRTTVYDFIKRKAEIIGYIENSSDETRKTFKKSNYPQVEEDMIKWCESQERFTKHDFFEHCKIIFGRVKNNPSHFCGSWSWCKRFLDRHPQFKTKVIKADGEPLDKSEMALERRTFKGQIRRTSEGIFHPDLDYELLQWCLVQESDLTYSQIAEEAQRIFESLDIKGTFNPTPSWVEKFVNRHSELNQQNLNDDSVIDTMNEDDYIIEELDENIQDEMIKVEQHEEVIQEIFEPEVSEGEAVNSLNTLLKFSQQRGNVELENLLNECRNLIGEGINVS